MKRLTVLFMLAAFIFAVGCVNPYKKMGEEKDNAKDSYKSGEVEKSGTDKSGGKSMGGPGKGK